MDTLAPATLAFRRRSSLERLLLDPALEIGAGGEAVVYEVPGDASAVAKVYHHPTIERARKLTLMLANPPRMPEGTAIAWPADLLLEARGFAGFLMPRAEGPRLFEFYNPVSRRATAPAFHFGLLHQAGRNLAAAFDALHAAGYVVGDVNESNILVHPRTAAVTLVDADSFQVRDTHEGAVFRSRVGKAEFTPPELQGVSFTDVDRAPEHDRFGLAVLLFLVLMEGTHPFAVKMAPGTDAAPVEDRIRGGLFPHARDDDDVLPPRMSPRFGALHPELRALFIRCFVQGHTDPQARPTPAEWGAALAAAEAALGECPANPLHRYTAGDCPWCERTALLGGRDPFPRGAREGDVRIAPRPRRARVAAPAGYPGAAPPIGYPGGAPYGRPAAVQPPQYGHRIQVVPQGLPAPAVLGPSGLRNPLVIMLPALAVWVMAHGFMSLLGFFITGAALVALVRAGWKKVTPTTFALAVCGMLFTASVMGLGASGGGDYAPAAYSDPPIEVHPSPPDAAAAEPGAAEPDAAASGEPAETPPAATRSMIDVMLADLYSVPLSSTHVADPGQAPAPGQPGPLVDADRADRLPVLQNTGEAARVLAYHYPLPPPAVGDTAMLWLHVAADGRVTAGGAQLIGATRGEAGQAAIATVPFLRYRPATLDGTPVDVWVTQRMVIVP